MKPSLLTLAALCSATLAFTASAHAQEIIEFRIAAGTGAQAWNSPENPVRVRVGQILRIFNDDSVDHYLHTPNSPCPHGTGPFGPGRYYDCEISRRARPETEHLYDHRFGPLARFYVIAD